MGNLNKIIKKTWNKQKFIKKQRPLRKYRKLINVKNRITLYWLSIKDIFYFT